MSALATRAPRALCPSTGRGLSAAPRKLTVDLSPRAVEQLAARVAALLQDGRSESEPQLLSAGELARRLRVERPWVYRHRHLLGGLRIGEGPKAPWRFDYQRALEALRRHQAGQRADGDGAS